jgi:hypothetical protein
MCAERELLLTQTTLTISTFKGARGRDKGCEPLTKEALDADLDAVSFLLFLGVFLSAYFNIKWILGAFNN